MSLVDALLFRLGEVIGRLSHALWNRFLGLTLIGKGFAVAVVLFAFGWVLDQLGLNGFARELTGAAWLVFSLVITAVIIRHIWLRFTKRSRYPSWY